VVRDFSAVLQVELEALRAADRLRAVPELSGPSRHHPQGPTGSFVAFSSNDYLGLASHPTLLAAATRVLPEQGFGAGAARLVTGNLPAHRELEETLATFLGRPAALAFPSGYQANLGTLTALAGPDDLIVSDAANHASLIDGCRLSRARIAIYAHADAAAAARALSTPGSFRRRLLVTESLFSMDGDAAPLAALAASAQAADAILIVDEAHALGVSGPGGRGLCAAAGVAPDVLVGTLGKAFGAAGGFVTGDLALRDLLLNRARTFVFTTAPPAPVAAAAAAGVALAASPEGDERRARLRSNVTLLAELLRVEAPPGPILPVVLGQDRLALTARLRVTLSSEHSRAEIERLAQALLRVLT
jgi:7-keto-8-aminopelargonate synthetase-like enzyme